MGRVVARIGTLQGRVVQVETDPVSITIRDGANPNHGGVLTQLNTEQAAQLAAALTDAIRRLTP
jgi:hypothetical protein